MAIEDEVARSRFRGAAIDGKITCHTCLELGEELSIPRSEIAAMLTEMDIKIINCQLGCFP